MLSFLSSLRQLITPAIKEAHYLFLIISVPAIAIFIAILPPAWGLDEQVHIARTYHISEGNAYPSPLEHDEAHFGGQIPQSLAAVLNYGHAESNDVNRAAQFFERKDIESTDYNERLQAASIKSTDRVAYEFGPTGPYSPVVYAPGALGMAVGRSLDLSVGKTITLAKSFRALMYLVLAVSALWIMRHLRAKWVLFVVATLPSVVFQASIITADTFTLGVVLLFSAIIIKLFSQGAPATGGQLTLLAGSSILLMFTKPSYALLLITVIFLPQAVFESTRQHYAVKAVITAVSLALLAVVSLQGLRFADTPATYLDATTAAQVDLATQLGWILSNPLSFLEVLARSLAVKAEEWFTSVVGLLGYNTVATPFVLMQCAWAGLLLAGIYAEKLTKKASLAVAAVAGLSLLSVVVLLYGTFNAVGAPLVAGVQGRYFIPSLPLLLVGLMRFLPGRLVGLDKSAAVVFGVLSTLVLYGTVYVYAKALY